MEHYDVMVLGGGPGGYYAALSLAKNGKNVAIVEKNKLGGTCLHAGCIPTKSLLDSAKHLVGNPDYAVINTKKDNDMRKIYKGLLAQIKHANIVLIEGDGKIVTRNDKAFVNVHNELYSYDNLIIATGSRNKELKINGLEDAFVNGQAVYSEDFLALESIPNDVVIIGGGVIGIEFASYISMLGKNVTILEYQDQILNDILDDDVREIYIQELNCSGIKIIIGAHIQEINDGTIVYESEGRYDECDADLIVVSCGRIANTENIGLEEAGITIENGFISTDLCCRTNVDNIYACGDVIGGSMLAHTAYKEAEVITSNICGEMDEMNYSVIPSVIYSCPEAAFVGISEEQCKRNHISYYVKKTSMLYSSRYIIEYGQCSGVCKLIFNIAKELIGAQLIGNSSSETIFSLADMVATNQTEMDIKKKIYPHPSFVEIIKETVKQ